MAKRSNNIERVPHINSGWKIKDSSICSKCPLKLYSKQECVTLGVGNMSSNYMFVLPAYNVNADVKYDTILKLLRETYNEIIGCDMLEQVYVTRMVKCHEYTPYSMFEPAYNSCKSYLRHELINLKCNRIVLFGECHDLLIDDVKQSMYPYLRGKYIYKVYNPAVLYYDNEDNIKAFKEQLARAIKR